MSESLGTDCSGWKLVLAKRQQRGRVRLREAGRVRERSRVHMARAGIQAGPVSPRRRRAGDLGVRCPTVWADSQRLAQIWQGAGWQNQLSAASSVTMSAFKSHG